VWEVGRVELEAEKRGELMVVIVVVAVVVDVVVLVCGAG